MCANADMSYPTSTLGMTNRGMIVRNFGDCLPCRCVHGDSIALRIWRAGSQFWAILHPPENPKSHAPESHI